MLITEIRWRSVLFYFVLKRTVLQINYMYLFQVVCSDRQKTMSHTHTVKQIIRKIINGLQNT